MGVSDSASSLSSLLHMRMKVCERRSRDSDRLRELLRRNLLLASMRDMLQRVANGVAI